MIVFVLPGDPQYTFLCNPGKPSQLPLFFTHTANRHCLSTSIPEVLNTSNLQGGDAYQYGDICFSCYLFNR